MRKRIFSILICLVLNASLLVTTAFAEELILPEEPGTEACTDRDEVLLEEEPVLPETPLTEELPVTEEAPVSLFNFKNGGEVECWLEGSWLYWRGNEDDLDYYAIELWQIPKHGAINKKLYRLYYYPEYESFFVVSTMVNNSYFEPGKWYTTRHYIYKTSAKYYGDLFEYLKLEINEDDRYFASVENVKKDGSYKIETTPWYSGTDLITQKKPIRGWMHRTSPVNYIHRSLSYSYKVYNVKETDAIRFQWQRRLQEEDEWEDIEGATTDTYMSKPADRGYSVRMVITAKDYQSVLEGDEIKIYDGIPLDEFTDPALRNIMNDYDNNPKDLALDPAEIAAVTSLKANYKDIMTLDGINYLSSLEELDLSYNAIYEADLTGLGNLRKADLSFNALDTLVTEGCDALEELSIEGNMGGLHTIGMEATPAMRSLDIRSSGLKLLDLRKPSLMRSTALYGRVADEYGNLKVPGTPGYTGTSVFTWNDCVLKMDDYAGSGLQVWIADFESDNFPCSGFRQMMQDVCNDEKEGFGANILSLGESQSIKYLDFGDTDRYVVTSLVGLELFPYIERLASGEEWSVAYADLSMNKELIDLDLGGNPLPYLSVIENKALETLSLRGCDLKTIDLSQNHLLKKAYLGYNKLESITLIPESQSNCLEELDVVSNKLTALDVSSQKQLKRLACYGNPMKTLDVRNANFMKQACLYGNRAENSIPMDYVQYQLKTDDCWLRADPDTKIDAAMVDDIQMGRTEYSYTGKAVEPTVTVLSGGAKLKKNVDYKLTYKNNVKTGQASVTATGTGVYGGAVTANFDIVKLELFLPGSLEVLAGKTDTLKAVFHPADTPDKGLTWKSDNSGVATVDKNGIVKGIARGSATITAVSKTDGSVKKSCQLTVKFQDAYYNLNGTGVSCVSSEMEKAINWASDKKITGEKVKFGTKNSMTRGQFVRFLYRYAGNPKVTQAMISKYGAKFTDVDKNYTHYKAIVWAVSKGLIEGYTEKGKQVFKPEKTLSRNHVATILWKFAGSPKVSKTKKPFTDVAKSAAFSWGKSKGIFKADTKGRINPKDNCIRGDFAVFLYRFDKAGIKTY